MNRKKITRLQSEKKETKRLLSLIALLGITIVGLVFYQVKLSRNRSLPLIVIDAGHDETMPGETGIITEQEYDRKVAAAVYEALKESGKVTVQYSVQEGNSAPVAQRVTYVNSLKPSAVLSFHADGIVKGDTVRPRILINPPAGAHAAQSARIGNAIAEEMKAKSLDPFIGYLYYHPIGNEVYQNHLVDISDLTDYGEETIGLMKCDVPVVQISMLDVHVQSSVDQWDSETGVKGTAEMVKDAVLRLIAERQN